MKTAITDLINKGTSYYSPSQGFLTFGLKIGVAVFLFVGIVGLFTYLAYSDYISKRMNETYEKLLRNELLGKKRKNSDPVKTKYKEATLIDKWNSLFIYSGLKRRFNWMSSSIWAGIVLGGGIIGYFIGILIGRSVSFGFVVAIAMIFILFGSELLMSYSNYKSVDGQLLEFINMLGNYSTSNSEVTGIFAMIVPKLKDPLKSAIEECIYEAQSVGTQKALDTLITKVEHPKFREIIQNLKVSSKYSASFKVVVENNRKVVMDYLRTKNDRAQLATQNMITLILCIVMFVGIIFLLGNMLDMNIWTYVFTTTIGHIVLIIALLVFLFFVLKMYQMNR